MTLHLLKLCVGCDSIEDLAAWQQHRLAELRRSDAKAELFHRTFQTPKRQDDVLRGGSMYWVIKGTIQVRQRITGFGRGTRTDGTACCLILLDPALVQVHPVPRRAFQGWRYFDPADAPPDVRGRSARRLAGLSPAMRKDLAALGLL